MNIFILGKIKSKKIRDLYYEIIDSSNDQEFHIHIDSQGGDFIAGLFFAEFLRWQRKESCRIFNCTAMSQCCSASIPILAACNYRTCFRSTQFLAHETKISLQSDLNTMGASNEVEEYKRLDELYLSIIEEYSNMTPELVKTIFNGNNKYVTPSNMVTLGLIDKIEAKGFNCDEEDSKAQRSRSESGLGPHSHHDG